jgi:hypothetical protein
VPDAAPLAGLADPDQALVPDLLREAARTLATVAEETRVRVMSLADCRDFVEALGSIRENWGKSAALAAPISELIAMANDKEEAKLLEAERQAEGEAWSDKQFLVACADAREQRLSAGTQYKHQCYVAGVVRPSSVSPRRARIR